MKKNHLLYISSGTVLHLWSFCTSYKQHLFYKVDDKNATRRANGGTEMWLGTPVYHPCPSPQSLLVLLSTKPFQNIRFKLLQIWSDTDTAFQAVVSASDWFAMNHDTSYRGTIIANKKILAGREGRKTEFQQKYRSVGWWNLTAFFLGCPSKNSKKTQRQKSLLDFEPGTQDLV